MAHKNYKYEVPTDKWYDWKGIKRPERQPNMTEEEMLETFKANIEGHICDWRQSGAEIQCDIGGSVHGKRIGSKLRLAGTTPEGKPVLVPMGAVLRTDVEGA